MGINYNKNPASHKKWVGEIMYLYLSLNERAVIIDRHELYFCFSYLHDEILDQPEHKDSESVKIIAIFVAI